MNERVDASIRYAIDVERPGMLHARLVRAPLAPARVVAVDASGVPGDAVCLLPEDVRDLARYGCIIRDQDVLPQGVVRHVGEPVAAVAAATERAARAAAELVLVEYDELPGVYEPEDALADGAPLVHDARRPGARRATCAPTRTATPATASACCTAAARPASRTPTSWSRASGPAPARSTPRWSRTPARRSGRTGG